MSDTTGDPGRWAVPPQSSTAPTPPQCPKNHGDTSPLTDGCCCGGDNGIHLPACPAPLSPEERTAPVSPVPDAPKELTGSATCPYCGGVEPHSHSDAQVLSHRLAQTSALSEFEEWYQVNWGPATPLAWLHASDGPHGTKKYTPPSHQLFQSDRVEGLWMSWANAWAVALRVVRTEVDAQHLAETTALRGEVERLKQNVDVDCITGVCRQLRREIETLTAERDEARSSVSVLEAMVEPGEPEGEPTVKLATLLSTAKRVTRAEAKLSTLTAAHAKIQGVVKAKTAKAKGLLQDFQLDYGHESGCPCGGCAALHEARTLIDTLAAYPLEDTP